MPFKPNDKLLLHMPGPEPEGFLDALKARFPGLNIRWEAARFVDGDVESPDAMSAEAWEGTTMLCAYPPASPANMTNVHFVQLISAGSDRWIGHPAYRDANVRFCSATGIHGPQIAEWVIGTWLSHQHHFAAYMEQQKAQHYGIRLDITSTDSFGRRVGILGYGAIGRNVARFTKALGMEVYAYTARERPTPESRKHDGINFPGIGDPDGSIPSKWFHGPAKTVIDEFLAQDLDLLVIALPLTADTAGLIGAEQFKIMSKKKTFLSNIGRGPIVDTDALIKALEDGQIRGAALDVMDPEPLPKGHPLWQAPNCFITPHVSWQSSRVFDRMGSLLLQNLERLEKGEALLNELKNRS